MHGAVPSVLPGSLQQLVADLMSARAADGQEWLVRLLKEQGPRVVGLLWRMFGREADVLDAYQTVVCHIAARGRRGLGRNRAGYFYRAAINTAIDAMRRKRREREHLMRFAADRANAAESEPSSPDHQRSVRQVRQATLQLPPRLRDVVLLRDFAGMRYDQLSSLLGITVGTARVYRRHAIVRLARLMEQEASS